MAVVETRELALIPLPVRRQRGTLEPDGYAHATHAITGDASGGAVQVSFYAPTSHVYILRAFSMEVDGGTDQGNGSILGRAFWLEDRTGMQGDFYGICNAATLTSHTNRDVQAASVGMELVEMYKHIPLGRARPVESTSTSNLFFVVSQQNVNTQVTTWSLLFAAYRVEAMRVPGFIDGLRSGLVR